MKQNKKPCNCNILIIDDLEDNIALIKDMLEDEDFTHIYTANSAENGFEILKDIPIDLVILDIMMPEIDGIQACKIIRDDACFGDISILLVTANEDDATLRLGLEAGANDYIRKPFINEIELIARINNLLNLRLKYLELCKKNEEIKEQERMLFQQSKMAAMGEMLGNIAHQWRQPLSMISATASGTKMRIEFGKIKEDEINGELDSIINLTLKLSQTIDDFRDFYKSNKEKEYFCINDIIKGNIELLAGTFQDNNIKVIQNIEYVDLYGFKNELIQVLVNLLNNSKDAFSRQDSKEKLIFIDSYKENDTLFLKIKDSAGGISEEIKCRVFEPYFTTKHQYQGTGLGLYMSKTIIEKNLNGQIFVKNQEYEYNGQQYSGAEFTIKLPIQ